nr:MAG TPA: hypothetical protein [Caudoviricetes sp.]DAS48846.1 MAG TPA: hypothetical protein [Caudoviricetes sp.]
MYFWYVENPLNFSRIRFILKGIQTPIFMVNRNLERF